MSFSIIHGDLLESKERVIAHQCNCTTKTSAGLAKALFTKYPYANFYSMFPRIPGQVVICGNCEGNPTILGMLAQRSPGGPSSKETSSQREKWFEECLTAVGEWMLEEKHSRIAFPYGIGCGLAKGNFDTYMKMLKDFQEKYSLDVVVYER
jgi:hypothetical protein